MLCVRIDHLWSDCSLSEVGSCVCQARPEGRSPRLHANWAGIEGDGVRAAANKYDPARPRIDDLRGCIVDIPFHFAAVDVDHGAVAC